MSTEIEIGNLVATARSLTTRAQAIIDLGASPDAMAVIFEEVLKTGDAAVDAVIASAVNTAIASHGDVAAAVEGAIQAGIDAGQITGVSQTELDTAIAGAVSAGNVATPSTVDDKLQAAIDGGSVETPAGAASRARQEIKNTTTIGGIPLSNILTIDDRIDLGVIN